MEFIGELVPYIIAGLAVIIAYGRSVVGRHETNTEYIRERVRAELAERNIDLEREQYDLRTRAFVDGLLQTYIRRNDELSDRLETVRRDAEQNEIDRIRQLDEMGAKFDVALSHARDEYEKRIGALENALREKDEIIELQRREITELRRQIEGRT